MIVKAPGSFSRRVSPLRMKTMNTASLFSLLRECGPQSRSDLARISRLSKPTVSEQVADLISRGLVIEVGQPESVSRRGKRPTLLRVNEDCGIVIAASISTSSVKAWEARLDGSVKNQVELAIQPAFGPDFVINTLKEAIRSVLQNAAAVPPHRRLISVSAPGLVDVRNGIVLETDNVFGWRDVSLGSALHWEFGIPVVVDNDVNLAVLAEARYGGGQEEQFFVLIHLDTGLGLGICMNGAPYHGQHWAAGEIAHMVPDPSIIGVSTGGRGHLESIVAMDRVSERISELAHRSPGPLADLLKTRPPLQALLQAASQGQESAEDLIQELTRVLGAAIANVSACYDPGKIILLGSLFTALFDRIRPVFESVIRWPVKLELSNVGDDVSLRGALVAGLTRIFDRLENELESAAPTQQAQPVAEAVGERVTR